MNCHEGTKTLRDIDDMPKPIKHIKEIKRPVIRPCPCAANHISCNYVVISHILGCPFDCSYCYLQTFYAKEEIVVFDDEERILRETQAYMDSTPEKLRIGTGEFSDSLAIPDAVSLAKKLIELFARQSKDLLELKTKSVDVYELLGLEHNAQTVIAWSVNPEKLVKSEERGVAGLAERFQAARQCAAAAYPVAFHFDPIIYYPGWEKDYKQVVDKIFSEIDSKQIAWISLGALRFNPRLKDIIRERFPNSSIAWEGLERGQDGKLRYLKPMRKEIFEKMHDYIRAHSKDVYVYLCMESAKIWKESGIKNQKDGQYFEYFKFFRK